MLQGMEDMKSSERKISQLSEKCRQCSEEDEYQVVSPCRCRNQLQFIHTHCLQKYFQTISRTEEDKIKRLSDKIYAIECPNCLEEIKFHVQVIKTKKKMNWEELTEERLEDDTYCECKVLIMLYIFWIIIIAPLIVLYLNRQPDKFMIVLLMLLLASSIPLCLISYELTVPAKLIKVSYIT